GGSIAGPATVCKGTNSGTLSLTGHIGDILNWEYSDDGFVAHSQTITNTTASLTFSNLISNRWYRAVVKNGVCSLVYSDKFRVTVTEIAGGTLSGPAEVCADSNNGTLTLESYIGNIIRWEWSSDAFQSHVQTIAHTQATYNFSNLNGDTWYRAVVGNNDCGEQNSAVFVVRFDELSLGGTISGTGSVCKGINTGTLSLSGHRGEILRWEYSTDGFASHIQAVANTSTTHTFSNLSSPHWYRAVVQNGSCSLAYSQSFEIVLSEIAGGEIAGPLSVCQSSASGELSLQDYVGNIIRWESSTDNFGSNTQAINVSTPQYSFTNLSGDTWFRVVVGNSDCGETLSAVWKVQLDAPSLGGILSGAQNLCSSQNSGTLQLQNQRGNVLRWESSTDNFAQDVQPLANTGTSYTYSNLTATTYFRAVVQNQDCLPDYSSVAAITLAAPSQAGALEGSATVCKGQNSGTLSLQSKVGQIIGWESSTDNFTTITSIAHTGDNLSYQDLTVTTAYRAVVQNTTCDAVYSPVATITVRPEVAAGQVAGSTTVITDSNAGEVQLQGATGPVLYWESSTDDFVNQVATITNTNTVLSYAGLSQTSWYRAVVQNGNCGVVYASPAKVTVNHAPLAQADTLLVPEASYTMPISVMQNDTDPDGNILRVISADGQTAAGGYASMAADGILYYEAPENYLGYDALAYTVCDNVSGAELCAEAAIVLDVRLPAPALIVYQGVSPNGDAHNDYWRIEYIERYPDNIVQLYDRLGMLVYEQQAYDNAERTFVGLGNKGVRPGGNELPEGTYYYKIITSDQAPVLQGYIVLKK
ncbi:MAG: gliding motility-associated C-terminal domain-containing protein, partial [Bacteroidetes bacterium]|nr:gliding motility-associated C-terminal domain-containing protein [Bacteroidota bacterium]